jgi:hypothetical protein
VKVVTHWSSKLTKMFLVVICITAGGFQCDPSMAAENSASADMTIRYTARRSRISDFEKKRRISAIIDANPAIKASIQDLVDHDPVGSDDDKTNRAVFAVYIKNTIFRSAVDAELDR